jgi:hypothetical protein
MAERRRTGKTRSRPDKPRARDPEGLPRAGEDTPDEDAPSAKAGPGAREEDGERSLARFFALGVPIGGVIGALIVGQIGGLGPSILVLAGAALLGTIGFFWASLRTLSGEAPLPEGIAAHALFTRVPAPERKRETLRALKDLDFEHSIGKIDDADYLELSTRYRNTAKAIMREMDEGLAPRRKQAETLVESYLSKRGFSATPDEPDEPHDKADRPTATEETLASAAPPPMKTESPRVSCAKCSVSNEPDAAFCKKCGAPLATEASATADKVDASV